MWITALLFNSKLNIYIEVYKTTVITLSTAINFRLCLIAVEMTFLLEVPQAAKQELQLTTAASFCTCKYDAKLMSK